ncbi:uncharacterized protein SPPG_00217 [Spizellomyces punctatus DAOM BR117]|uniref:TRAM domain-containing protein n=1 Tax=Spizellomyces punctatus (strain DAOM BR117) TaxID=645134 RepID=A0A0L0HUE2_SPIPD|nr:uncharacterized protein SPPG_00217 [Spizellomyces punctatus DAOM BR117]KND04489.1 hypothetical protein SPPG_00217 [Spizellomyces punctatus DAOM BR117]|eukprot:XP_016612528.1 hypothetical protein SPPG_00217 [Spizellomyces punctatus DAOM BR117]
MLRSAGMRPQRIARRTSTRLCVVPVDIGIGYLHGPLVPPSNRIATPLCRFQQYTTKSTFPRTTGPASQSAKQPWIRPRKPVKNNTPNDDIFPADFESQLRSLNLPASIPYLDSPETQSPYTYHEEATITIFATSDSGHGFGVGKDNWLIAVPSVLEGEEVVVKIYRDGLGFSLGELVSVQKASELRTDAQCKYFGKCGGCGLQHVQYEEQLRRKRRTVLRAFAKFATELGIPETQDNGLVSSVIPSPLQYNYRTKMSPHYDRRRPNVPLDGIGFNERGRKSILDVEYCAIATKEINQQYSRARAALIGQVSPTAVNGATLLFRHTLIPPSNLNVKELRKGLVDKCHASNETLKDGVSAEWPPKTFKSAAVVAHRAPVLDVVNGYIFQYPANTFFQTNSSILPHLTDYIRSQLRQHRHHPSYPPLSTLVDAYCGSGLFSITAHNDFSRTIGIEIEKTSLHYATRNAKVNEARNCFFYEGDVKAIFDSLPASLKLDPNATAVIIDPPSKGCGHDFLNQLLRFGPRVVIYVSCNVKSQVEDLRYLMRGARAGVIPPATTGKDIDNSQKHSETGANKTLYRSRWWCKDEPWTITGAGKAIA